MSGEAATPLWKEMVATTGQDYWKDWILGLEKDRALPRPWTVLSNAEIDRLARNAYISYHGHPGRLWHAVRQVKSWSEFKRKSRAFLDMLFSQEKASVMDQRFLAFNENQTNMLEICRQRLRAFARQKRA